MTDYTTADRNRSLALAAATAALVTIPTVGPLLTGRSERSQRYDTVITPPAYAFAIWGPIFAGCAANAVQQLDRHRATDPANRRSGWPLVAAYGLNALWSVAAQSGQRWLTPAILPAATACAAVAYRRLQGTAPTGAARLAPASTGLLLGWTALASVVNLATGAQRAGAPPNGRGTIALATAGVGGVAGAVAATVARSRQGFLPLAGAAIWGLATTALMQNRSRIVRAGAASGAALIGGAAAFRVAQSSCTGRGTPN